MPRPTAVEDLPGIIGTLGRELAQVEERAASALLSWSRGQRPEDLKTLRLATGQRALVEARLRRNLAALVDAGFEEASHRLSRSIRWEARDAYLRGLGLGPEKSKAGTAPRLEMAG